MVRHIIALALSLAFASTTEGSDAGHNVVELPRPNSGTFTTDEATVRKSEILSNKPTEKLASWKNPYSGFSIHINTNDRITVYGSSGLMTGIDDLTIENGVLVVNKKELTEVSIIEVRELVESIPLYGNPAGILITSDRPLKESKVIEEVIRAVFAPSIQVFYIGNSEQISAG